jgi:hypothetical protein
MPREGLLASLYAQCLEGQDEMAMRRIDAALALPEERST